MSFELCQYNESLGVPNEGIHAHRLFGVAIVDVLMTIFGGYLFSKLFNTRPIFTIAFFFLLGIALHRLFCVRTTIDMMLFS